MRLYAVRGSVLRCPVGTYSPSINQAASFRTDLFPAAVTPWQGASGATLSTGSGWLITGSGLSSTVTGSSYNLMLTLPTANADGSYTVSFRHMVGNTRVMFGWGPSTLSPTQNNAHSTVNMGVYVFSNDGGLYSGGMNGGPSVGSGSPRFGMFATGDVLTLTYSPVDGTVSGQLNQGVPTPLFSGLPSTLVPFVLMADAGASVFIVPKPLLSGATSMSSCLSCPLGSYAAPGSSVCAPCAAGSFCVSPSSIEACAAGWYSAGNMTTCAACVAGTYSTVRGASSCLPCPGGFYCPGTLAGMDATLLLSHRVLAYDNRVGDFFSNYTEARSASGNVSAVVHKYSILGQLESYRNADGSFHFVLDYPLFSVTRQYTAVSNRQPVGVFGGSINEWFQTSNPVMSLPGQAASDYVPLMVNYPFGDEVCFTAGSCHEVGGLRPATIGQESLTYLTVLVGSYVNSACMCMFVCMCVYLCVCVFVFFFRLFIVFVAFDFFGFFCCVCVCVCVCVCACVCV